MARRPLWRAKPTPLGSKNDRATPTAVAVGWEESVIDVGLSMLAIVAPPGMPSPETGMPTFRSDVLARLVTLADDALVEPVRSSRSM